jgi:UDP-N-acetylglucosamine diphosphorylase/glucosamine-1-phosphate N-acetyltransferase
MQKIVVDVSESLAEMPFAGRTVLDHWMWVLDEAGVRGRQGHVVHLDARMLTISVDTVRRVADGEVVVPPDERMLVEDGYQRSLAEQRVVARFVADLARSGVVVHDPERVWVETTVKVAPGATLWGGCFLRGKTVVCSGAVVHPGAVLVDTFVGEGSEIKPNSYCEGAVVGADCSVGPMAHLRPGTHLHEDVKVGNFVEVKKATLYSGVRASHLSYLGDAEVGAGANIGAGTITCNYDGFGKYRTVIGAGAFVGSNTALVAPVRVGDGAIVGAGSTVTRDIPDDALMVERADERTFPGKAPRIRERSRQRADRKNG